MMYTALFVILLALLLWQLIRTKNQYWLGCLMMWVSVGILVGNNLTRDDPSYTPLILCGVVGFVTMTINLKR